MEAGLLVWRINHGELHSAGGDRLHRAVGLVIFGFLNGERGVSIRLEERRRHVKQPLTMVLI